MPKLNLRQVCAAIAFGVLGSMAVTPTLAAGAKTERVIVAFKPGKLAAIQAEIARRGGHIVTDLREVNAVAATLSPAAVALLKKNKAVAFVERDVMQHMMGDEPSTGSPYALGQTVPYGIPMVQADK
jgi:hypothetical protein